jgi:hypothetical protein
MTEPVAVDVSQFFDFIDRPGLAVLLLSVHPQHTFSGALSRQLATDHQDIALGTMHLMDLVTARGPALPFLHQQFRASAISTFGVLPGYCLFRGPELLAWDAGLPSAAEVTAIGQSALLGVLFSTLTSDLLFIVHAVRLAAEQVAVPRIALKFRQAATERSRRRGTTTASPPPFDEVRWAYELLGVSSASTDREVHQAWRRKRIEMHPDGAAGDPVEFERRSRISADINRARDVIIHDRARAA